MEKSNVPNHQPVIVTVDPIYNLVGGYLLYIQYYISNIIYFYTSNRCNGAMSQSPRWQKTSEATEHLRL